MKLPLFGKLALVGLVGAILAGCAATRIDVDVYKGPLTNHEHVQMEQMAAMAIGAKPLLIALRNQLEPDASISNLKSMGIYRDGYIPDDTHLIGNANARRVNDIISLYDDQESNPELQAIIESAESYLQNLEPSLKLLMVETEAIKTEDSVIWKQLEPCLWEWKDLKKYVESDPAQSADLAGMTKSNLTDLKEGWRQLLNPGGKTEGFARDARLIFSYPSSLASLKDEGTKKFLKLANREWVSAQLELVLKRFPGDSAKVSMREQKKMLMVNRSVEIAKAFLEARFSLERLMTLALRAEEEIPNLIPDASPITKERLRESSARFAAGLISPSKLEEALKKGAHPTLKTEYDSLTRDLARDDWKAKEQVIANLISMESNGPQSLLQVHKSLKKSDPDSPYGLCRGPNLKTTGSALNADEVNNGVSNLRSAFATSVGGGRLQDGIESLISRYVRVHAADGESLSGYQEEKHILIDALVRFAQKVLFVANNEALLNSASAKEYTMVLQSVGNSILVQANELELRRDHRKTIGGGYASATNAFSNSFQSLTAHEAFHQIVDQLGKQKSDIEQQIDSIRKVREETFLLITNAIKGASQSAFTNQLVATGGNFWNTNTSSNGFQNALKDQVGKYVGIKLQQGTAVGADEIKQIEAVGEVLGNTLMKEVWKPATGSAVGSVRFITFTNAMTNAFLKAQTAYSKATNAANELVSEKEAKEKVISEVKSLESGVCVALSKIKGSCTPEMAKAEMIATLREGIVSEGDDATKANLKAALSDLQALRFHGFTDLPEISMEPNKIAVLDSLIAQLQYEYLQTVKVYGRESKLAKMAAEAIKEAYIQRSGMAYVRPASDYLKSSYPATALQDNPQLGWYNMLEQSLWKSIPGASVIATGGQSKRIGAEIDKQYWQTINSVRVSGSGRTQYVIAKDDVGNWYVKGYSTNPEDVINSAKNLASFSLGNAFDLNMPVLGEDDEGSDDDSETVTRKSTLQKIYSRYGAKFLSETTNSIASTLESLDVDTLVAKIRDNVDDGNDTVVSGALDSVLEESLESAREALETKNDEVKKAIKESKVSSLDAGVEVLKAVKLLERFREEGGRALENATFNANGDGSSNEANEKDKAKKALKAEINSRISSILEERREIVDEFSSAIDFIAEAANED